MTQKHAQKLAQAGNAPLKGIGDRPVVMRAVASLKPYDRNARTHSPEQVDQIIASIGEWGWTNPVLIDEAGLILAGHGRTMAAVKMGLAEVPCIVVAGLSDVQKRAYVLADNKLALNAGWDEALLNEELKALGELNFALPLIGFDLKEVSFLANLEGGEAGLSDNYSRKIEAPIYEIRGDKPTEAELADHRKTDELKAEIEAAELPADVRAFLLLAAERHTVFNFSKIAEYYAHAPASTQRLFEKSALVIIDFDQAIENGFVSLNKGLMDLAGIEHG